MENSNFNTVVVRDSRIQDISNKLDVVVNKGSATNTYQEFNANTQSTSSVNFNIALPSESIIMDREVTWEAEIGLQITVPLGAVAANALALSYGVTDSLNQFPLNSLVNTATATINNASVSINTRDIMHILLRSYEDELFSKYNTPHMSDKRLKKYSEMALTESNPLGSFKDAKGGAIPRGSHPISYISVQRTVPSSAPLNRSVNSNVNTVAEITEALTRPNANDASFVINLVFKVCEPLLFLSPFLFGENNNNAGLYGVNNMNLTFNIDSSAKKVFSSGSANADQYGISLTSLTNNKLKFNFLTSQPSDIISNLNVLPFTDYQRYITNLQSIASNSSATVISNALQLSQIPNKIYIAVRKPLNNCNMSDSNSFFAIEKCNITFNNLSGILSGANATELYRLSKKNGSKQDLYEFLGSAATGLIGNDSFVPTCGSVLVLSASDLHLPDYLSNGSNGQFSFQFQLTVKNLDSVSLTPELVVITENSGLFITQSGQSTKMTALMTKDIVLNSTMNQHGESQKYINKQNGDSPASTIKNIPLMNQSKMMKGSGVRSGGAFSGGALSGGAFSGGGYY